MVFGYMFSQIGALFKQRNKVYFWIKNSYNKSSYCFNIYLYYISGFICIFLAAEKIKKQILQVISKYFTTIIEIKRRGILELYYFFCLKKALYLIILCSLL